MYGVKDLREDYDYTFFIIGQMVDLFTSFVGFRYLDYLSGSVVCRAAKSVKDIFSWLKSVSYSDGQLTKNFS